MSGEVLRLHVLEEGPQAPVPVGPGGADGLLLLHGLYGNSGNLRRLVRHFADHHRVLAPDLRNHGRSPHDPTMTYAAMVADVVALLDERGVERVAVLGHSMGGKVAMQLALDHPERVTALVPVDIAPVRYQHGQETVVAAMQRVDTAALGSRGEADAALAQWIEEPGVRQFLLTNLQSAEDGPGYRWRIPLEILAAAVPVIEGFPEGRTVYDGPTHLIYGERSDYVVPALHRGAVLERFPRATFRGIPEAGHWVHAERPEAFIAAVEDFLGSP